MPDELLECANAARQHFKGWGFTVAIEPAKAHYPMTPTMVCSKKDRTLIIEVHAAVVRSRLEDWASYCASYDRNRELALCAPPWAAITAADMALLAKLRAGLYYASADEVTEVLRPVDLAMRAELPKPKNLPPKVRRVLSDAYEHWNRGDWKDAFGLATEVLEEHAREYLKREASRGRIVVLDRGGKPVVLTHTKIGKMTLGSLAATYTRIQAPTDVDSTIATILGAINSDRVKLRHYRNKKAATPGFRRRVGPQMHMIVRALKEAINKL